MPDEGQPPTIFPPMSDLDNNKQLYRQTLERMKHPHNMPEAIRLARLIGGTVDRDKLIGRLALCSMPSSSCDIAVMLQSINGDKTPAKERR
jgi:hypothetical protein